MYKIVAYVEEISNIKLVSCTGEFFRNENDDVWLINIGKVQYENKPVTMKSIRKNSLI
jgi:hypothetical protein